MMCPDSVFSFLAPFRCLTTQKHPESMRATRNLPGRVKNHRLQIRHKKRACKASANKIPRGKPSSIFRDCGANALTLQTLAFRLASLGRAHSVRPRKRDIKFVAPRNLHEVGYRHLSFNVFCTVDFLVFVALIFYIVCNHFFIAMLTHSRNIETVRPELSAP